MTTGAVTSSRRSPSTRSTTLPTRTELLTTASPEIAATQDIRTLIDLGSGSSIKTRLLLDAQTGDQLLVGADLVKSSGRLTAAHDDRTGITAAFNRNLIEVLRRELDAVGLYPDDFEHIVRWRPADRRIDTWLRTRRRVQAYVKVLDRERVLGRGAEILTCTKVVLHDLQAELTAAGFTVNHSWTDRASDYSLTLAQLDESLTPLEIGDSHDH